MQLNLVDIAGGLVIISSTILEASAPTTSRANRLYAKMAEIPALEPSTLGEARELTRRGFEISERMKVPVFDPLGHSPRSHDERAHARSD
jgi:indolepyruvate ferredoxin oxidoreductase alpha subunit